MWILYQLLVAALLVIAGPLLLVRRGKHYLATIPGRLGSYRGPLPPSPLWIHAVSVGEVGVAATLARSLPASLPLVITTVTPTGQARARTTMDGRAAVTYLPFELGFAVRRFLDRFAPRALILVEGDLWPLVLRRAKERRLPVVVVNGRMSDRSFRRMARLRRFLGPLLDRVDRFAVQTEEDRRRLVALGVCGDRVTVTGNLKFDAPVSSAPPELASEIGRLADGRPLLVAGSTMAGEEELVLEAFAAAGGGDRALLVLAPRHPERWDDVERVLAGCRLDTLRRSRLAEGQRPAVLLLDTLGELAGLYGLGLGAFIGGTLVPTGGHNPLEAAAHGVPIAAGPSMENFREMASLFDRAEAWARVSDARELAATWRGWLEDPAAARRVGERGARLVAASRGALARTLEFLAPVLHSVNPQEDDIGLD